jgi:hypothetical protein
MSVSALAYKRCLTLDEAARLIVDGNKGSKDVESLLREAVDNGSLETVRLVRHTRYDWNLGTDVYDPTGAADVHQTTVEKAKLVEWLMFINYQPRPRSLFPVSNFHRSTSGDLASDGRVDVAVKRENAFSLVLCIEGRDAIPVRAIPYVTGWQISPDEVAKQFARYYEADSSFARLKNTSAYQLRLSVIAPILPKEWDGVLADIKGLEAKIRTANEGNHEAGYAEWRQESALRLPSGVFVWLDEFEKDFQHDFSPANLSYVSERVGDRELILNPMMSMDIRDAILDGFQQIKLGGLRQIRPSLAGESNISASDNDRKFYGWLAVEESKPIRFSDLPHMVATALHPSDSERMAYASARINLENELSEAVRRGDLIVRNAAGLGHHTLPIGDALKRSVVLPSELKRFLEGRGIELRLMPHGSGPVFWTLENAAIEIAEQEGWHDSARGNLLDVMKEAADNGALKVRDPRTDLYTTSSEVRTFWELVTPADVNDWLESQGAPYRWNVQTETSAEITYQLPMFSRLEPKTPWKGSRLAETDVLTLSDAAIMASKHAKTEVTQNDILRAASRGEIPLHAILQRRAVMRPCRAKDRELPISKHSILPLPLTACQALANVGRAIWRHFEGFEPVEQFGGAHCRFTRWQLPEGEPDFVTTLDDCRVMGIDLHALADAFIDVPVELNEQGVPQATPAHHKSMLQSTRTGITKHQALAAFDGLVAIDLAGALEDGKKWVEPARLSRGAKGQRHTSMWDPVLLAIALYEHKKVAKVKLNRVFFEYKFLTEWREEWHEKSEDLI